MPTPEKTFLCSLCTALLLTVSATAAGATEVAWCGGLETVLAAPPPEPRPTASIEGRVVDEQGVPVEGASLMAMLVGFAPGHGECCPPGTWVTASTGVDGRFVLAPLRPDLFEIRVSGPDLQSTVVRQRVGDRQHLEGLEIVLPTVEIAVLEGRVVDANGAPVAGAQIFGDRQRREIPDEEMPRGTASARREPPRAGLDHGGRRRPRRSQPPRHPPLPDWPEVRVAFEATDRPMDLEIRLSEGSTISGHVSGLLPGETVTVEITSPFLWPPKSAWIEQDGPYRLDRLPPGTLTLKARTQHRSLEQTVEVATETSYDVDFVFDEPR